MNSRDTIKKEWEERRAQRLAEREERRRKVEKRRAAHKERAAKHRRELEEQALRRDADVRPPS